MNQTVAIKSKSVQNNMGGSCPKSGMMTFVTDQTSGSVRRPLVWSLWKGTCIQTVCRLCRVCSFVEWSFCVLGQHNCKLIVNQIMQVIILLTIDDEPHLSTTNSTSLKPCSCFGCDVCSGHEQIPEERDLALWAHPWPVSGSMAPIPSFSGVVPVPCSPEVHNAGFYSSTILHPSFVHWHCFLLHLVPRRCSNWNFLLY